MSDLKTKIAALKVEHPDWNADEWVSAIVIAWQDSVKSIIHVGFLLMQAKAVLGHGEFGVMVNTKLPFSWRVAQHLMKIAKDRRLQQPDVLPLLPPHWRTLADLTRLTDDELADRVRCGNIHPKMERADVKNLVSFVITSRDIRRWSVIELKKAAVSLSAIANYLGAAEDTKMVGDVISNRKLGELFKL